MVDFEKKLEFFYWLQNLAKAHVLCILSKITRREFSVFIIISDTYTCSCVA